MASLVRVALLKFSVPNQGTNVAACAIIQKRNISGKAMRSSLPPRRPKPPPFDYVNKDYTWFRSLFDRTTHRFDENSKVVVVEGPIAAGKTEFAQTLAKDLGMKHFPEANMDYHYMVNGINLREFDDQLAEDAKTFDHCNFNLCPTHRNVAAFQMMMYTARYGQYVDALAHLLNTGQGVVLERSPFSDFVFMEAMASQNYISKKVKHYYYDVRGAGIEDLLRPHLVIYLDLPVDKVKEAIRKRNCDYEVRGQALTDAFLTEMERQYKEKYLQDISKHSELLVYDWTGGGEVEVVVEDIERLDFDQYVEREEPKMKDWRLPREEEWSTQRQIFTNGKYFLMNQMNIPVLDIPELIISGEDEFNRMQVYDNEPKLKFMPGYSEGGWILKNKCPKFYVGL